MTHDAEDKTRQRNLLIALAVLLLLAAWRFGAPRLSFGEDDEVATPVAAPPPTADSGRRAHSGDRVAVLRVASLDRVRREPASRRDPWRFVDPPRPHVQPPKSNGPASEVLLPKVEQPLPHPAELNLQYLGRFGPPNKQIAVFTRGKAIFNLQEGDVIDHHFIVAHIGYEAVEIRFLGFPDLPAKRVAVTRRQEAKP
ncbi:MAG TPA: hypothetical protein VIA62_20110 [Thermoanaerobaculia bacterium]|nr:hypothetical protein [Thermoanaerobaculia bacterium]